MGNLLPMYTGPRCLLERQAVGGCDVCREACPHAAIDLKAGSLGIEVDPERCTGCGLCVQSCPTGALEYDLTGPLEAIQAQARQSQQAQSEATLTCSQSGAGGPALPCLGRVSVSQIVAAGAWGIPLPLIHGDCAACPVGSADVPQRLLQTVEAAQNLRAATGQPADITLRPAVPADHDRALNVSRRGAFAALFRAGGKQVVRQLPERPLPFVDWSEPQERVPQEWKWRRQLLKPAPGPQTPVLWPAPLVDDTCIDCPVCANVCPTTAIVRELQPDGGVQLLLNLAACTGCMACLRSCPPQAIHEQREWLPAAFAGPLLLRESDSVM